MPPATTGAECRRCLYNPRPASVSRVSLQPGVNQHSPCRVLTSSSPLIPAAHPTQPLHRPLATALPSPDARSPRLPPLTRCSRLHRFNTSTLRPSCRLLPASLAPCPTLHQRSSSAPTPAPTLHHHPCPSISNPAGPGVQGSTATASISTRAASGRSLTAKVARAGGAWAGSK